MIADVLFEDLRDPQLRGKKREDLVNQNTNYRLEPFSPPMPKDLEALSLAFSRAYSGVGQCTLTTDGRTQFDRDTALAAHSMLTAFFRTEASDKVNSPQTGERDDLMRNALFLDKDSFFQDFPDFLTPKPSAIADTPLTGRILTTGQKDTVTDLRNELRGDFEQLRGALPNRADWRVAVEQLRTKRERDILGDITQVAQFGPRMLMLQEQANRIYADWNKPDGLRTAFYARIDNAELGGIVYTQRLIQQIQDQINVEQDGFVALRSFGQVADPGLLHARFGKPQQGGEEELAWCHRQRCDRALHAAARDFAILLSAIQTAQRRLHRSRQTARQPGASAGPGRRCARPGWAFGDSR
jgi:hypothetical protein